MLSLKVDNGSLVGFNTPSYIVGSWEHLINGQSPCGASYSNTLLELEKHELSSTMEANYRVENQAGTRVLVSINVSFCRSMCSG